MRRWWERLSAPQDAKLGEEDLACTAGMTSVLDACVTIGIALGTDSWSFINGLGVGHHGATVVHWEV